MSQEKDTQKVAPVATQEKVKVLSEDYFADFDFSKLEISIEEMFKSGVHFGHSKSRKHPKADEYVFTTRNGISIIDLQKTIERLKEAMEFISQTTAAGEDVLFVGTKKQAKRLIESAARKAQMPYINERWLGGTFTNFPIISKRAKYLKDGQEKMKRGDFGHYTKFEQMKFAQELERLEQKMGGIKEMQKLPGAVFVASVIEDELAIKEAKQKNIPIIAFVDSNINPVGIDYPIPANEDAVSSLKLMLAYMVKAVLDGQKKKVSAQAVQEPKKEQ